MLASTPLFVIFFLQVLGTQADRWAVLVAGSNGYWNYRHQADVAHAYQIMMEHGMDPKHVITMMYDDVAESSDNPFPGKLFNSYKHIDVYHGVKVDYRGDMVTPENFLKVLLGDKGLQKMGYKVLNSTEKDTVFVYFTDHGAEGLISFPYDDLYSRKLNKTLTKMFNLKKYSELVFYLEACESGSMFEHILSPKIKIFATTAANAKESSWGDYCEDPEIDTCLGDAYSTNWMEDADSHDLRNRTFQAEYAAVKTETKKSHVQEYGDMSIAKETLAKFIGARKKSIKSYEKKVGHNVESRQIEIHTLMRRLQRTSNDAHKQAVYHHRLTRILQLNDLAAKAFELIYARIESKDIGMKWQPTKVESLQCYEPAVKAFTRGCFKLQKVPAVGDHLKRLYQMCHLGYDKTIILDAVNEVCN